MTAQTHFRFTAWDEPARKVNRGDTTPRSCQELEGTCGERPKAAGRERLGA